MNAVQRQVVKQRFRFLDVFGRERTIDLEPVVLDPVADALLVHESGRIYEQNGNELRLVGSYNEPVFDKARPHIPCTWRRVETPCMFEHGGALLGRVL